MASGISGAVHIDPDQYFYSREVADIAKVFPIEAWLASAHICPLLENSFEQWVQLTAEKLLPSGKEHNVSDRAGTDTFEWSRALDDTLSRVAPLMDETLIDA